MANEITISKKLADHTLEYMLLLRQAIYASGEVRQKAIDKLDGYGTPIVAFEKAVTG